MIDSMKTAIVTGSSSGMGAAIALKLAADGFAVIVNYAGSKERADRVVSEIESNGGKAISVQANVSLAEDVKKLFDEAEASFGRVDVLVNNAGKAIRKPLAEFSEEEYDTVMNINLKGVFLGINQAAKRLQDNGHIVNISASFQGAPIPGYGPYAASKMAIEKLTEVAAKELGERGITVNAVRPGPTETNLFNKGKDEKAKEFFASQAALGRLGQPEDIANVVSFLVSDRGGWVTGQAIGANGGYW